MIHSPFFYYNITEDILNLASCLYHLNLLLFLSANKKEKTGHVFSLKSFLINPSESNM